MTEFQPRRLQPNQRDARSWQVGLSQDAAELPEDLIEWR